MAIGYCPTQRELQYHAVDYSNPTVIQGLLRFYYDYKTQSEWDMNAELVCIYCDLETAIANIDITDKQKKVMHWYMEGYTEDQIGVMMGNITHQAVRKLLMKVCTKVSLFLTGGE
jgi:DNA-binding CsgD family transcriptional regulator